MIRLEIVPITKCGRKELAAMELSCFPRRRYSEGPTPIEAAPRFSASFCGPEFYFKRDDLLVLLRMAAKRAS